jgi:hypothetical protein
VTARWAVRVGAACRKYRIKAPPDIRDTQFGTISDYIAVNESPHTRAGTEERDIIAIGISRRYFGLPSSVGRPPNIAAIGFCSYYVR